MSTREKVEELLADVLPKIEALKAESLVRIGEVAEDANEKRHRHEEAVAELAVVEDEIEGLSAEKEEMPVRHSGAVLEDDVGEELRLKQRYQDIGPELEALEGRKASLSAEIRELLPHDLGHRHDINIHHVARVAGTTHEELRALEDLRDRLRSALDAAIEPLERVYRDRKALVEAWGLEREWDPVFRERAYGKRRAG